MSYRVSTLLRVSGVIDSSRFTAAARDRGVLVHQGAKSLLGDRLPAAASDPDIAGHLDAIAAFAAETSYITLACEERFVSADGFYHGRPDLVCCVTGGSMEPGLAIVDIKTGNPAPWHGLQLAFYELLVEAAGVREVADEEYRDRPWMRFGLYTSASGTYRLVRYESEEDAVVASAILDLARWRARHGLMPDIDRPDAIDDWQ